MKLSLIVAMSRNGVIGRGGGLPWDRIPEDMANFRRITMGHPVIMGRKTWQSLDGPLPGRKNIVLGRSIIRGIEGVFVVRTPAEAIVEACDAHGTDKAFVIGGAETYRLFAPLCDEAHVTLINSRIKGDVRFPCDWMCDGWSVEDVKMLAPGVYYSRRVRPEA